MAEVLTQPKPRTGEDDNGSEAQLVKVAFIDNRPCEIQEGETILSFLRRNIGKNPVPTLCDAPNLKPFGSCRVCSVDVALEKDGIAKAQASCHTPLRPGSYISEFRKNRTSQEKYT